MIVVLAGGCFDPLHYGHVLYLRAAKKMGDRLVVGVTTDRFINKGPLRPVFSQDQRVAMLRELRCVDQVVLVNTGLDALRSVRPDVYVKGPDWKGKLDRKEIGFCKKHRIRVCFTKTPKYSSTALLDGSGHIPPLTKGWSTA